MILYLIETIETLRATAVRQPASANRSTVQDSEKDSQRLSFPFSTAFGPIEFALVVSFLFLTMCGQMHAMSQNRCNRDRAENNLFRIKNNVFAFVHFIFYFYTYTAYRYSTLYIHRFSIMIAKI